MTSWKLLYHTLYKTWGGIQYMVDTFLAFSRPIYKAHPVCYLHPVSTMSEAYQPSVRIPGESASRSAQTRINPTPRVHRAIWTFARLAFGCARARHLWTVAARGSGEKSRVPSWNFEFFSFFICGQEDRFGCVGVCWLISFWVQVSFFSCVW